MRSDRSIRWDVSGRLLMGALVAVALALAVAAPGCAPAGPAPTGPIQIDGAPWRIGEPAELVLHTVPPRSGAPITLTLLAPGDGQPRLVGRSPEFFGLAGVQLLWLPPEDAETEVLLAAAAGARTIGLDFDWRRIEPAPGEYRWAEADRAVELARQHGLRLVPMLLYTPRWASSAPFAPLDYDRAPPTDFNDYRNFCYAVVSRYRPYGSSPLTRDGYGITDWVIWNEPNMTAQPDTPWVSSFWLAGPHEYLRLLRAGYEGVRAADPDSNVLNGGLADVFWAEGEADLLTALERLYDPDRDGDASDGGRPFFDTLNVHTYQADAPDAAWYHSRLTAVARIMAHFGDRHKPIWITETGYGSTATPSAGGHYVDLATQAAGVELIYETCAAHPQVERVFWWSLRDYYHDVNHPAMEAHYGLLHANFAPKPAYLAYARLTGSVDAVLTLHGRTDADGVARITVPASFVDRPGTYVVFAVLDSATRAVVATYEPVPAGDGGR